MKFNKGGIYFIQQITETTALHAYVQKLLNYGKS